MLLEFTAHTDSAVLDVEFIIRKALFIRPLLDDAERNRTSCRRIFDRIRQDIQQNLIQPERVGHDVLICDIQRVNEQLQPF